MRATLDLVNTMDHRHSMVSQPRLRNLANHCTKYLDQPNLALVECGVGLGGCLAVMHASLPRHRIYGFDAWNTMPMMTPEDANHPLENRGRRIEGKKLADIRDVYRTFELLSLDMSNVELIQGYFEDTLHKWKERIGAIAILRLDADFYAATALILSTFYDQVIDGGVILIDDYEGYPGCRKAVHDFLALRNVRPELIPTYEYIDEQLPTGVERYWVKAA